MPFLLKGERKALWFRVFIFANSSVGREKKHVSKASEAMAGFLDFSDRVDRVISFVFDSDYRGEDRRSRACLFHTEAGGHRQKSF